MVANCSFSKLLFTGPCTRVTVNSQTESIGGAPLAIPKTLIKLPEILGRVPRPVVVERLNSTEYRSRIHGRNNPILAFVTEKIVLAERVRHGDQAAVVAIFADSGQGDVLGQTLKVLEIGSPS